MDHREQNKYPCVHSCPVVIRLENQLARLKLKIKSIKDCGSYKKYKELKNKLNK